MVGCSLLWKDCLSRQYKNDPDLRAAVDFAAFALVAGICATALWDLISTSFCALLGVVLLSALLVSRRRALNPLIAVQAALIGFGFGSSITEVYVLSGHERQLFAFYVAIMTSFHYTEFMFTAFTNRRNLQADSFLLSHSVAYWLAAAASWAEFFVECFLLPSWKSPAISRMGLLLCVLGEVIRKAAMVSAGTGFTHRLAYKKRLDHRLTKTGVYAYVRHPGYLGWLLWSIGTQVVLCNPFCFVVYAIVTWRFFDERIYDEERKLIDFFHDDYVKYQEEVWIGIPFVQGYRESEGG